MSVKSHHNHKSSAVVSARAQYSTSVLDQATTICFLLQDMRKAPSKKQ
jgi:hypothetical protein